MNVKKIIVCKLGFLIRIFCVLCAEETNNNHTYNIIKNKPKTEKKYLQRYKRKFEPCEVYVNEKSDINTFRLEKIHEQIVDNSKIFSCERRKINAEIEETQLQNTAKRIHEHEHALFNCFNKKICEFQSKFTITQPDLPILTHLDLSKKRKDRLENKEMEIDIPSRSTHKNLEYAKNPNSFKKRNAEIQYLDTDKDQDKQDPFAQNINLIQQTGSENSKDTCAKVTKKSFSINNKNSTQARLYSAMYGMDFYKFSGILLLIKIKKFLENNDRVNLKIDIFMKFVINHIVNLCVISQYENKFLPTKNETSKNTQKLDILQKIDIIQLKSTQQTLLTNKINILRTTDDNLKMIADYFRKKINFQDYDNLMPHECSILEAIIKIRNQLLPYIAKKISANGIIKTCLYCFENNYWLFEEKHSIFIFSNHEKFLDEDTTKNAFNCHNILSLFLCQEDIHKISKIFLDCLYTGFVHHSLTFDILHHFFSYIMTKNQIKCINYNKNDIKYELLTLIDLHEVNVELLIPQFGLLKKYSIEVQSTDFSKIDSKQTLIYVCFLQLFEIFLKLDWQKFINTPKKDVEHTKIIDLDKIQLHANSAYSENITSKINFFNAFKICLNDISAYLIFPYLHPKCFTKYVSLIQYQNIYFYKAFITKNSNLKSKKVNLYLKPIFWISRLFFANELYMHKLQNDQDSVRPKINNSTYCSFMANNMSKYELDDDDDCIFSYKIFHNYMQKNDFACMFGNEERREKLIIIIKFYLKNMSNVWRNYKFETQYSNWVNLLNFIQAQFKDNEKKLDLPKELHHLIPTEILFAESGIISVIG
ncbi:hypothetical protein COBT_000620, partial [Conglomerata obtusa]